MQEHTSGAMKSRAGIIVKILIAVVAIVIMFLLFRHFKINELLRTALNWINGIGIGGMAVYAIFYIAATVLFVPGSILTLGGGFLYGVVWGTALVSVSSVTGASLAFLIGRYLARGWINKKIEKSENFRAIDEAVGREGWKIVLLCRLSPAFPYNMLNYAFGLTRIRFWHYLLASWIGMLPVTVMYVYLGSLASDISTLGSGGRVRTPAEWGLYLVGFLAAVGVTVFVTRLARKALRKTIGDELTSVDK